MALVLLSMCFLGLGRRDELDGETNLTARPHQWCQNPVQKCNRKAFSSMRPWLRLSASQALAQWHEYLEPSAPWAASKDPVCHRFARHSAAAQQILALRSSHKPGLRTLPSSESPPRTCPAQKLKPSMHWSRVCAPGAGRNQLLPLSSLVATLGVSRTFPVEASQKKQLIKAKRDMNLEPKAAPTSFMLWRTNRTQACSWKSQKPCCYQSKTSNDCHTLMTTCSRPPKSPKTSSTATKRSSGNAYSHVCSDCSGS